MGASFRDNPTLCSGFCVGLNLTNDHYAWKIAAIVVDLNSLEIKKNLLMTQIKINGNVMKEMNIIIKGWVRAENLVQLLD